MQVEKETIKIFIYSLVLLGLIIESIEDIREKKVWIPIIILILPTLIIFNCRIGNGTVLLFIGSFGIGALFYIISIVTDGRFGKGDALVFCMTGAGIGFAENLFVIYMTFLFAFLAALFLCLIKKVRKDYRIPLVPFVLCAYLVILAGKIWNEGVGLG